MEQGAKEKFLSAHDTYVDALFRHCYFRVYDRELAKDLVQEAFLRTWTFLSEGKEIENFRAFLYRVLHNLIVDEVTKKKFLSLEQLAEEGFTLEDGSRPDQDSEQRLAAKEAIQKLEQIAEPYRSAVQMRLTDDLSPKEIASILGVSENVASVRIHRGINKLRQLIEKELS